MFGIGMSLGISKIMGQRLSLDLVDTCAQSTQEVVLLSSVKLPTKQGEDGEAI